MSKPVGSAPAQQPQPSVKPAEKPPADPNAPGLKQGNVTSGPNKFDLGLEGPDPNFQTGGTHDQQEAQRDKTIAFAALALVSYATGHAGVARTPSDGDVTNILKTLNTNPPIGTNGKDVTHAVYQSQIPNASAQAGYDHFVNQPGEVFSAGGMELRPPTSQLKDGGRYMIEIGGPVPTWLPVEIHLDPAKHSITINTLDGHVLRGEQTFTFTDDGKGGSVLTQDARFQVSSKLPKEMQQLASVSQGQHSAWENAHREIFEQFNGNPGYKGMGTDLFNKQQLAAWGEVVSKVVSDPGGAADAGIGAAGEIANWGIDLSGREIGRAFDKLGIPGGKIVAAAFDKAGDVVSAAADAAGDAAKAAIRAAEAAAKALIKFVPWP